MLSGRGGPALKYDGRRYLLSYYDMSELSEKKGFWFRRNQKEYATDLLPSYSHYTFPYRRISFVRPLQWWLKEIIRLVKPHGDCSRWKGLEPQMISAFQDKTGREARSMDFTVALQVHAFDNTLFSPKETDEL